MQEYPEDDHGRRSLPPYTVTNIPDRLSPLARGSTPNISWKNRPSLNLDRNNHNNNNSNSGSANKDNSRTKYFPELAQLKMSFGSPSYPSPLDRIRSGHQERKLQLGLSPEPYNASFEANQSFPKASRTKNVPTAPSARKLYLDNFKASELNDVSFTSGLPKGAFSQYGERSLDQSSLDKSFNLSSRDTSHASSREVTQASKERNYLSSRESSMNSGERSLAESWSFYNHIGGCDTTLPSTVRNPNKALCTINGKTSEILTANEMASELFGYEESELIGLMLKDLVKLKPREQATIMESHLEPTGKVVNLSGKVVDAVDKNGLVLPVSIWVKKLGSSKEPRCLVVMEPVERTVASVKFAADGTIVSCDNQLAYIHGYRDQEELKGYHIRDLIPALKLPVPGERLPKDIRKQRATGRTRDGANFPLSIAVEVLHDNSDVDDDATYEDIYRGVVWVFANISGLITFLPDGTIHNINDNFSLMLFGFKSSEVIGKNISMLIPDFYEILDLEEESMPLPYTVEDDKLSLHSKDSGKHSSRCSSKVSGASRTDSEDAGIGLSLCSSLLPKLECFGLHEPGVTSTPNKSTVLDTLAKRLSTDAIEQDTDNEITTPSKHPPAAELKIDAVTSPENSSPNHSTISTSSADTLLTARDTTCTNTTTTSSSKNTQNVDSVKKCVRSTEYLLKLAENDTKGSVTAVCKIDSASGQYKIEKGSTVSTTQTGEKLSLQDVNKTTKGSTVSLNSGRLTPVLHSDKATKESVVSQNFGSPSPVLKTDKTTKESTNHNCGSSTPMSKAGLDKTTKDSAVTRTWGSLTPISKPVAKLEKSDILASPCLSDIMKLESEKNSPVCDSEKNSPVCDSSAVEGDDELEYSESELAAEDESEDMSNLNATDDLAESMGHVKLDRSASKSDGAVSADFSNQSINDNSRSALELSGGSDLMDHNQGIKVEQTCANTPRKSDKNGKKDSFNSDSEKENYHEGFHATESESEKSSISVIEDIDESLLHRSSIHQFLNSRCNKSRMDNSNSILSQNNSRNLTTPVKSGDISFGTVETYYPVSLETPDLNRSVDFSNLDGSDLSEGYSPSLQSFEKHEKGVRYIARSGTGSRASDFSLNGTVMFPEGSFQGQCQHRDQTLLGIVFQVKRVQLDDGQEVYCMWVSRDPEEPAECVRSYANLTLASSLNSTVDQSNYSLGEALMEKAQSASKDLLDEDEDPLSMSSSRLETSQLPETEEDRAIKYGPYSVLYDTINTIGKGAFGFVKMAQRKADKKQVVVKFIRRVKVFSDCWVKDSRYGRIPLEVSILRKLDHPNIVGVIDVFENAEFIQMVMEKHGSGMDLFEFIDRSPNMDEPLASYIFRQMVSAVSYLHSKNILHRDIKDENVIVNEQFQIKLIDFGAVAFLQPGKMFATFCGTLEYCSPEVLLGNKYEGPELEVWSLGVTLYTLVFGENPFFDVEETIKCVLKPPFPVSSELMMLICWMLHPDANKRATVAGLEKNCWVTQRMNISQYKWSDVLPNSEFHGNTASDNRPDTPPTSTSCINGHLGHNDDIDDLKCNLMHKLSLG